MYQHPHSWPIRVLLGLDQDLNVWFGPIWNLVGGGTFRGPWGFNDETISSVLGKLLVAEQLGWRSRPFATLVQRTLDRLSDAHTFRSIEYDEGWPLEQIDSWPTLAARLGVKSWLGR